MGMFDWINFKMDCVNCGAVVDGFQSKDRDCTLATLEPDSVNYFYSSCKSCGAWIEFDRVLPVTEKRYTPLTLAEVTSLGFKFRVEKKDDSAPRSGA